MPSVVTASPLDRRGRESVAIAYVNPGKTAKAVLSVTLAPRVTKRVAKASRFTVQSAKRASIPLALGDMFFQLPNKKVHLTEGKLCPLRVIRKTIFVGRPEYKGAGVWA